MTTLTPSDTATRGVSWLLFSSNPETGSLSEIFSKPDGEGGYDGNADGGCIKNNDGGIVHVGVKVVVILLVYVVQW